MTNILLLGGWTKPDTLLKTYIAYDVKLPLAYVELYSWISQPLSLAPAAPIDEVLPEYNNDSAVPSSPTSPVQPAKKARSDLGHELMYVQTQAQLAKLIDVCEGEERLESACRALQLREQERA